MTIPSVIAANNKRPGVYTRVSLGVGQRANGDGTRYIELFGNKTAGGSAVPEVEHDCYSEDESRALHGPRSELFWMFKAVIAAWPGASVKCIAIAESGGTAATGTIVCTGPATGGGAIGVAVYGEEIEVPFASGDAATAIGAAVALAITGKTDWPVTAANVSGTVTVTFAQKGPRGNFTAVRARIITAGVGVGVTGPVGGYLTGGATSDDPQNALDALAGVKRRYYVAPYSDATQLAKFKARVDADDEPEIGHRERFLFGSLDTLGNFTTLVTGLNQPRGHAAWLETSDLPPSMIAAGLAARIAARESVKVSYNFDGEIIPGLRPHALTSKRPTDSQIVAALNNGITPLQSADDGSVYIVRAITTKSRDLLGNADYRVLDIAKVAVPDEAADRSEFAFADRYRAFNASQNPAEGELPVPETVTPAMCEDLGYEVLLQMEADGLLEAGSVERNKALIQYELSTSSPGRFNGILPTDVIEGAHQFGTDIRQIG